MTLPYLNTLNAQQRRAVEHGIAEGAAPAGPLLVIAGAGSGKTKTLAHRVAHLLVHGADPYRILLMTFSRRAAAELSRRAERISAEVLGERAGLMAAGLPWAGTFHGIGARLLRDYAEAIGLAPDFSIHDREDSADLINLLRSDLGFAQMESRFPTKATCLDIYSRAVNSGGALGAVLQESFPWCLQWEAELRRLFGSYVEAKQAQGVLDYDDLLLYWARMQEDPGLAAEIGGRFDHVLVDEYQDTNRLQAAILMTMKPNGQGLTVVGDDAQAIYAFRAATVRNILDFPAAFVPPADVVTLDRNYRSTRPILDAANAVIGLAAERFTKDLWTDRAEGPLPELVTVRDEMEQARCVALRVLEHREAGLRLRDQAVLFRTASHSTMLEVELTRRRIPFVKFGGLKFLDSAHVKDVLALLRFAQNPRDLVAGFRIMLLLPGAGPATARRVLDSMTEQPSPIRALGKIPVPSRLGAAWGELVTVLTDLHHGGLGWPAELERACAWYEPMLEALHEEVETRRADLLTLQQIAGGYASRERFLTELTLDPPDATSDQAGVPLLDEDYLILSTIHSAKGQEWRSVFLLNAVDGCIPSDLGTGSRAEIEEERRLLYVAMTRAREGLHILLPQRFFTHAQRAQGDRHVYASRTRFIPREILDCFNYVSWPGAAGSRPAMAMPAGIRVDVAAQMRGMWG